MPASDDASRVLVDMARLRERFDDDEALLAEIFQVFEGEAAERRAGFEAALAAGDLDALTRRAHSLKGVAATMFAEPLRQAAYTLEMAARAGEVAAVAGHVAAVLALLEATCRYVQGLPRAC
jgi:HPt (histidine-containing phosphotransfer) domain-containing protein